MTRILRNRRLTDGLVGLMLALAALGLLVSPRTTSEAAREGLYICINVLIPSLFPFFVISMLSIELGLAQRFGRFLESLMRPLFRVGGPCAAAVALGFLGGYPVGAKCAISLYEKGLCSKEEAERLLAFCNNSGPAFILGAAGIGILGSNSAGWLLFLTHTFASLTVGLLFRFYRSRSETEPRPCSGAGCGFRTVPPSEPGNISFSAAFTHSVKSSFVSVFYISSFVIFFTVIVRLLFTSGALPAIAGALSRILAPLGMTADVIQNLLTGLIELTSGLYSLQGGTAGGLAGRMAMAAFMLGWAGLSVHCQVLYFIGQSGLSPRTYLAGKILHACISAVYAFLLARVTGLELPAAETIAGQVETIAHLRFFDTLTLTLTAVGALVSIALPLSCILSKKRL
jgi:sporulation integral membrane protein YlbJ